MSFSSPPPAVDTKSAAEATAAGNQNASIAAQIGNMTNQAGPVQYELDLKTGKPLLDASGNKIALGSTGVNYPNPYVKDAQDNLPFDMTKLTAQQKADYYAGKGLPKKFSPATEAQQWTQQQVLGGNDRTLFDESQASQLQLSALGLTGLNAVRSAVDPSDPNYNGDVKPTLQIQGGPSSTTANMVSNVPYEFSGGGLDTGGLQGNVRDAGNIRSDLGRVDGNMQYVTGADTLANTSTGANALAKTTIDNNGNLIQLNSGANQQAGGLGDKLNNSSQIQTNLGLNPTLLNQQATDALYKANTQYLDPQFGQSQSKLESQLANQGITRGSEAYNNAMLNFNNQKQQAYESARNQAIGQGTAAAQGLFGMGLQGAQFGNSALGQQFGQNVTAQQLANSAAGQNNQLNLANQQAYNSALGQQFGQGLQAGQFGNQAVAQNNANALANSQFANQAIAQNNANAVTNANFANTAQQQSYNQALGNVGLSNTAQAQQYGQNLSDMQAQNAAVNQRFGMDTANQNALNNAQLQRFNAGLGNANLNNQIYDTQYNQALQSAQLNNQASNQQLAQNQAIQQNPLNILQALRTGAQLNTANLPAVGVSQPGALANWSGPDYLGAANATNQYNQGIYNADTAATSGMIGAGIGAVGNIAGGAIKKSDIRLKKNIVKLGIHKTLGIGLYTWDYLWGEKGAGVMAQELEKVMPEAVITHESGFKMVDYSMLGA